MKRLFYLAAAAAIAFTFAVPGSAWAPGKIRFKYPKRLDLVKLNARVIPLTDVDPGTENIQFSMTNAAGTVYSDVISAGSMLPNTRGNSWKFKQKKDGSPMIYSARIREKLNKKTFQTEFLVKVNVECDAAAADPARNGGFSEADSRTIYTNVTIGDDVFFINAYWDRIPRNIERAVRGWKLSDKYMAGGADPL